MNPRLPLLLLASMLPMTLPAAADGKVGSIDISGAWARATPPGARVAGAYLTLHNEGSVADRLVSVSSTVAASTELHVMKLDKGIMSMRPLPDGVDLPPGGTVTFQPSGYHIMLVRPTEPLRVGATVTLHLNFEKAGAVDVDVPVGAIGAKGPNELGEPAMQGMKGDMPGMKMAP